jgi:hypothetical protein
VFFGGVFGKNILRLSSASKISKNIQKTCFQAGYMERWQAAASIFGLLLNFTTTAFIPG